MKDQAHTVLKPRICCVLIMEKPQQKKSVFVVCVDACKGTKQFNTCLCFQNIFWIGPKLNLPKPKHLFKAVMTLPYGRSVAAHMET